MANAKVKIEMHGAGGGRWGTREEYKRASEKRRRAAGKKECDNGK